MDGAETDNHPFISGATLPCLPNRISSSSSLNSRPFVETSIRRQYALPTELTSQLGASHLDQHNDQLPVGLLAQLVERCTGIAEVMGSNPVRA